MSNLPSIGVWSLSVLLLAAPALAQQSPPNNPPTATEQKPAIPAPTTTAPEPPTATVEPPPATVGGPASTGDLHLVVATVKLKDGLRASKLIGSAVFNDQNEKIGSIDDLILTRDNKVAMAIISVGGFLGMGNKLVAVPSEQLRLETTKENDQRVHLAGGTKEALNAMPSFSYGNG